MEFNLRNENRPEQRLRRCQYYEGGNEKENHCECCGYVRNSMVSTPGAGLSQPGTNPIW